MKSKRSLGQNFFINKNLGDHIINSLKDIQTDTVVEIGPGTGFFTERLVNIFKKVILIEKDNNLVKQLETRYPTTTVINADILEYDLTNIYTHNPVFFGSLPYNISKKIIRNIVENPLTRNPSYFIIQKEVAEKYIYRKPYSALSLITNIYSNCKKILDISPDSFRPKPNVNSSFVSFTPLQRNIENKDILIELINTSFKQPRKNMHNNLKGTPYEKGIGKYSGYRPAQLSLDEYIEILNNSL